MTYIVTNHDHEKSAPSGGNYPGIVSGAHGPDRHAGCARARREPQESLFAVKRHAGISPEMAVRLSQAFGRSPESWLQLQAQYDLAQVRKSAKEIKIQPLRDPAGPQP